MAKHEIKFFLKNGEIWVRVTSEFNGRKQVLESVATESIMPVVDDYLGFKLFKEMSKDVK